MTPPSSSSSMRPSLRPPADSASNDTNDRRSSPKKRLQSALREATSEVEDALDRLQMAKTDVEGDNEPLDDVEALIEDALSEPEHLRTNRARRIADAVADDLETVVARLRRAARRG